MSPYSWALKESVVGHMVFLPGLRSLQWQIFENGQWLWNNLRSMGLPLMANEVQVGPLYPLTLLYSWLPDSFFWFFFVSTKIVFASWAALLLGQRVFRLSFRASFVFCVSLAFALYVLRFINHPWHNAFTAFLWYLLSAHALLNPERKRLSGWPLVFCLSFYALLTAGFPSATALHVLLFGVFFIGFLFKVFRNNPRFYLSRTVLLVLLHIPGLLLAAPMIFPLLELISLTPSTFRSDYGLYQVKTPGVFLGMVHRFWNGNPPYEIVHVIRLIPLLLMGWGVYFFARSKKKWEAHHWGVFAVFVFAVLKYFPVLPPFNKLIGSLPVLERTHFTIYGFSFFLIPFSYWIALGAEGLLKLEVKPRKPLVGVFIFVLLMFLGSVIYAVMERAEINPLRCILVLPFLLSMLFLLSRRNQKISYRFSVLFFVFILLEALWTQPSSFLSVRSAFYQEKMNGSVLGSELAKVFTEDYRNQFRIVEGNGLYSKWGFSNADVGGTAILPERYQRLRTTLFEVPWKGYLPIDRPKFSYSYPILASSIYLNKDQAFTQKGLKKVDVPSSKPVWIDESAPSKISVAERCSIVSGLDQAQSQLGNPNTFQIGDALLETSTAETIHCKSYSHSKLNVKVIQDKGDYYLSEVVKGPALLNLSQLYYPGWQAKDEMTGDSLQILPANLALSAVWLPEDRDYQVAFSYQPWWLRLSKQLVFVGLFLVLGLVIMAFVEKRQFKAKYASR
ncbi:YfhO family protein [bacterium]|nr:YfhO family protein [bacterium]